MDFYWIKLNLARLKLKDIPDARYIYFIFLEPITDQDLLNKIYSMSFWLQKNPAQILEVWMDLIIFRKWKIIKWPMGRNARGPQLLWDSGSCTQQACGPQLCGSPRCQPGCMRHALRRGDAVARPASQRWPTQVRDTVGLTGSDQRGGDEGGWRPGGCCRRRPT
jgi:hypothetical protein